MAVKDTPHWVRKRKYRPEITDDVIEYCIQNSNIMRDRDDPTVFNAIARVPPSGRILKVAYRKEGKDLKIITAYWLN